MKRREFIALLGGAAAYTFQARAQQPAMPVVGFLNSASADGYAVMADAFKEGLKETGYVEDLQVLANLIPADGYLHGPKPTIIDAAIYGFIANIYFYEIDTPLKEFVASHLNL